MFARLWLIQAKDSMERRPKGESWLGKRITNFRRRKIKEGRSKIGTGDTAE